MSGTSQERINPARAWCALALLLGINLFNYVDRYILSAVEPELRHAFFKNPASPEALGKTGSLATAFLVSYMLAAPLFGLLADRVSRWKIVGLGVAVWSIASAASGFAHSFGMLLVTRMCVGIGEAAYGPAAPTIIADLFPLAIRGRRLALFYAAIPVGSALGYAFGGSVLTYSGSWRVPFYLVAPPGLLLALFCFFMHEPQRIEQEQKAKRSLRDYLQLFTIRSYLINTVAMAALTFAIGGLAFWVPSYIYDTRGIHDLAKVNIIFGAITVAAGLLATLAGGWIADKLRPRFPGAYFQVSGIAMLIAFPFTIAFLYVPFPAAWVMLFVAIFFLFFNTGPSNTALANVTHPAVRASAFALNILIIHAAGDALSPPLIGTIAGYWNMNVAFGLVSVTMLLAGIVWLWGARYLPADTERAGS